MASERWLRGMIVTAAVASPAAAAVLYWVEPTERSWYPRCWLHWLTGLHCPFCGTTRSGHALLNGDIGQALAWNVLAVGLLPLAALWLYWTALCVLRRGDLPVFNPPTWLVQAFLLVLLLFFVARNLPFYPFDLLAPHRL